MKGIGLSLGFFIGYIAYVILTDYMKWDAHFYGLAAIIILIAFLGDMVFAIEDSSRIVKCMTPADAVRGKYKLHEEKIKDSW